MRVNAPLDQPAGPHGLLRPQATGYGHAAAFATAFGLLALTAAGVIGWLALHGEETTQRRIAQSPSITVLIQRPATPSPGSTVPRSEEAQTPVAPDENAAADTPLLPIVPKQDQGAPVLPATSAPPPTTATPAVPAPALPPANDLPPVDLSVETTGLSPVTTPPVPTATPLSGWRAQSRAFDKTDKRPRIGLIVTGLGLAALPTRTAIEALPADVTLAFQSLAPNLPDWIEQARRGGHEALLAVPMEPRGYPQNDPGPQTLLNSLPAADNAQRLTSVLSRSDRIIGILPLQGDAFVANGQSMAGLLDMLKQRDLAFVDSTGNTESTAAGLSLAGHVPFAQSALILDATASRTALDQALAQLETRARTDGSALGIVLPYPVTFERLNAWLKTLPAKGIVLAPVSALLENTDTAAAVPAALPSVTPPAAHATPATGHKLDLSRIKRH